MARPSRERTDRRRGTEGAGLIAQGAERRAQGPERRVKGYLKKPDCQGMTEVLWYIIPT